VNGNLDCREVQDQSKQPWLVALTLTILAVGLGVRLSHSGDLPSSLAYEVEAASRMLAGQCPFSDFYFDQCVPTAVMRMPVIGLASLIAFFSGASPAIADSILNIAALGPASVLATSVLSVFSFWLSFTIISRFGQTVFSNHCKWIILMSMAIANMTMIFEYGSTQHIFVLLLLPYLFVRWCHWQGAQITGGFNILTAVLAAIAAALHPLFLLGVLVFELVEILQRRRFKLLCDPTLWFFITASLFFWSYLALLPKEAAQVLFDWILPIKFNSFTHESFSFYGTKSTPDRCSLFYYAVFALIFAFAGLKKFALFRPLSVFALIGLAIWVSLVWGLSADALILTYFTSMLLCIETYFVLLWVIKRYPRFFIFKKESALAILIVMFAFLAVTSLLRLERYQRYLAAMAPERLRPRNYKDLQDLASAIERNSRPKDMVFLINGKMQPASPLLLELGRRSCGYFISTEALGALAEIRRFKHNDAAHNTPPDMTKKVEKLLYQRLRKDILRQKPLLICQEQGDTEDDLRTFDIKSIFDKYYEVKSEANFFTDHNGLRELSEYNYNYNIYKLKDEFVKKSGPLE